MTDPYAVITAVKRNCVNWTEANSMLRQETKKQEVLRNETVDN